MPIIIQPDAAAGKDNSLSESAPALNQGTAIFLSFRTTVGGRQRPILQFDLSPLVGFEMGRAELRLFTTGPSPASPVTVTVNRIAAGNSSWTELGSSWNVADTGRPWAGDVDGLGGIDAGCSIGGTDYEEPAIGVGVIPASSPTDYELVIPLDLVQLAAMVGGANYGFVLTSNSGSGLSFRSSDYTVALNRPALVAYEPDLDSEDDPSRAVRVAADWSPKHRIV